MLKAEKKNVFKIVFLACMSIFSSNVWSDEWAATKFSGMQLAWSRLPSEGAAAGTVVPAQPRQQAVPNKQLESATPPQRLTPIPPPIVPPTVLRPNSAPKPLPAGK